MKGLHILESSTSKFNTLLFLAIVLFSLQLDLVIDVTFRKIILGISTLLFILVNKRSIRSQEFGIVCLVFFYVFYCSFPGIEGFSSWINFGYISLFFFFLTKTERIEMFFLLKKIFSIILLFGIVSYILVVFNVLSPLTIIFNPIRETSYDVYPFFFLEELAYLHPLYSATHLFRFNSIFDEPGYVGTLAALILLCRSSDRGYDRYDYVLMLAGFLSFSLAFYILFALTLLYQFKVNIKYIYILLLICIFVFLFRDSLDSVIFSRLEFEDGKMVGDNRVAANFDLAFSKFSNSEYVLWGMGNAAHQKYPGSSSFLGIIYNYGYVGALLYLMVFFSFLFKGNGKRRYFFFLIFMLNVYQRPYTIDLCTFTLLFMGIYTSVEQNKKNMANS